MFAVCSMEQQPTKDFSTKKKKKMMMMVVS
jgi:hypothetical protein